MATRRSKISKSFGFLVDTLTLVEAGSLKREKCRSAIPRLSGSFVGRNAPVFN